MPNLDLIEASLMQPMDWEQVEALVCDVLIQDDFPRLRRLGGVGDEGADAVEEAFYQDEQRIETVVQITSEKSQVSKFKRTVARLKECEIEFDQLTLVYRDPVENDTRRKIREAAAEDEIAVDIRDQAYLTSQLGKLENGLFARYFQDVKSQVNSLLNEGDPLKTADDRLMHAVLASLGAYVANPFARLVKTTLFDRTVIAVLVAQNDPMSADSLIGGLKPLMPDEEISENQLNASIARLVKDGLCEQSNGETQATDRAIELIGATLIRIRGIYRRMFDQLIEDVRVRHKLNDAQRGYLDRNLRRALAYLVRL
ncbi:MAG: hypothetical protein IH991_14420, partial [Planctomycetes bacterium]|nr:hypothetical protein [Planctomycetota bacterium]